jgi:hypothetical protein
MTDLASNEFETPTPQMRLLQTRNSHYVELQQMWVITSIRGHKIFDKRHEWRAVPTVTE